MSQHESQREPSPRDDDVARLLEQALHGEPPSEAYVARLFEQLDREFLTFSVNGVSANGKMVELRHERNGHASSAVLNGAAVNGAAVNGAAVNGTASNGTAVNGTASNGTATIKSSNARRVTVAGRATRPRRRWMAGLALAAMVLVAITLSNLQPKYSWASMVEAMKSQPWVQAVADSSEPGPGQSGMGQSGAVRGWISWVHGVVARRSDQEVVFDNLTDGVRNRFRVDEQVIYRQPIEGEAPPSPEEALLNFVLYGAPPKVNGKSATVGSIDGPIDVVDESWQEVSDDSGNWIELHVEMRVGKPAEIRKLRFVLDPETHLPSSARLAAKDGVESLECRLSYPADGPLEVHAASLGVPAGVPIRFVTAAEQTVRDVARADVARADDGMGESALQVVAVSDDEMGDGADDEMNDGAGGEVAAPAQTAEKSFLENANYKESVVEPVAEGLDSGDASADAQVAAAGGTATDSADDGPAPPVPSDEEMASRVDELLSACWQQSGIRPAEMATDGEYLRRVYLDLAGRIPKVSEVDAFVNDTQSDRRVRLLDELLDRYDHATHLAAVWRRFLLPDGVDLTRYGGPIEFERWLADRFRENAPYDQIVRELLLAEGRVTESGPLMFYTALRMQPEELAGQTSRVFLGTRMECAQCHDHFFDDRWTQEDFWGYAAFFARISRPEGKLDMVSTVMRVQDSSRGEVMIPETDYVVPPRFPEGDASEDAENGPARRQRLADWLTRRNNEHFSRATVNRVWAHLFGKGLVDPVDDMRPDNLAQCPEVLDELATYFANSGFDLQKLIRTLALTDAYQLSSSSDEDDPSRLLYFAQMHVKTFTAEQLYDCIAVATRMSSRAGGGDESSVERFNNSSRQEFLDQFRAPPGQVTEYHAGIPQALTLMNGGLIQGGTDLGSSGFLQLLEAPFFSDSQRVKTLFMATLSRPPSEEEQATMGDHLAAAADSTARQEALGDILWVLLNSAEFTLNH